MINLISNFIEYDINPLDKDIEIHKYEPLVKNDEELKYSDIGYIVRVLRNDNRLTPIFHIGENIFSLEELKKLDNAPELFKKKFKAPKKIVLNINNQNDWDIIENLLASMIINYMMRDLNITWKIYESSLRSLYTVLKYSSKFEDQDIKLFTGFTFTPKIINNNRIGIFLDYRSRLFYENIYNSESIQEMVKKYDDYYLIDFCPLNCPEKFDPYSTCRLSVPSTGRIFHELNDELSENTLVNKEENLIEYHKRVDICKLNRLGFELDPKQHSIKILLGNKFYDYPPERLKPRVRFDKIKKKKRDEILSKIFIPPYERYKITLDYAQKIKDLSYDKYKFKSTNPITFQKEKPIGTIKKINQKELILYRGRKSRLPSVHIIDQKPYDFAERKKNDINLKIIYLGKVTKVFYEEFNKFDWLNDFKEYFHFNKLNYEEFNEINRKIDLFELKQYIKKEKIDCIILVYGILSNQENNLNLKIKEIFYKRNIPIQGINTENFLSNTKNKTMLYFRNIYLGIYAKLGFLPWKIDKTSNNYIYFIGMNTRTDHSTNSKYLCLSIYNYTGELISLYYDKWNLNEFDNKASMLIKSILNSDELDLTNEKRINFLVLGRLYDDEKEIIIKQLNSINNLQFNVYEVQQNNIVRLYEESQNRIKAPRIGNCFIVNTNNHKEAYFIPIKIKRGTNQPTRIRHIYSSYDFDFNNEIEEIFDLTQLYIGYTNIKISLPIPIHAVRDTLNKLIKNRYISHIKTNIPIFI